MIHAPTTRPMEQNGLQVASQQAPAATNLRGTRRGLPSTEPQARKKRKGPRDVAFDWDMTEDTTAGSDLLKLAQETGAVPGVGGNSHNSGGSITHKKIGEQSDVEVRDTRDARTAAASMYAQPGGRGSAVAGKIDDSLGPRVTHWSEKAHAKLNDRDARIMREDFGIQVKGHGGSAGTKIPRPLRNWTESQLPDPLMQALARLNYVHPTPIQRQCVPLGLMGGRDVIGLAETGSGKTAAFVLPMVCHILKNLGLVTPETALEGPFALVLAPTRELAEQISIEAGKLSFFTGVRVALMVGGLPIDPQVAEVRRGVEILVATPGRLNDCLERRLIALNQCEYIVLDEADRMLDMGFEPQVRSIMDVMPATNDLAGNSTGRYRQTFMFSATMPVAVEGLARSYLRRPVTVAVGETGRAAEKVRQHAVWCTTEGKKAKLAQLLERDGGAATIVFCSGRKGADDVGSFLESRSKYRVKVIHGGKPQEVREAAVESFKNGATDVLVATDVIGRGIDIPSVRHVINYELPAKIADYTHRIGRTGRAGRDGKATSLVTNSDDKIMNDLYRMLVESGSQVPREIATHDAVHDQRNIVL
jgi:ATP-dependent RNA helicase DDX23/PRP28